MARNEAERGQELWLDPDRTAAGAGSADRSGYAGDRGLQWIRDHLF